MLEYLETQGRRGPVQGDHIYRPMEGLFQDRAHCQRVGERLCGRQPCREQQCDIHIAQGMGLTLRRGAEQVDSYQFLPV